MAALVVKLQDSPPDLEDGIAHVLDEVIPAAGRPTGSPVSGSSSVTTGERLSVMIFEDDEAARALFAAVGERRSADPERNRPQPVSSTRYEVYAAVRA